MPRSIRTFQKLRQGARGLFCSQGWGSLAPGLGIGGPQSQYQIRGLAAQTALQDDNMLEVTVNGEQVKVPKGYNVLQACEAAGVDIPR